MISETLMDDFLDRAKQNLIPLNVNFEVILSCPLKCRHCYNFDRLQPRTSTELLNPDEISRILGELADMGTMNLSFTGGEPLLHPRIEDFIAKARELAFITTIKTNALLLDATKIQRLKNAGLNDLDISLYGSSDETYKLFTSADSAHTRVSRNIDLLIQQGFKPEINVILHRGNVMELDAMVEFVQARNLPLNVSLEITDRQDFSKTNDYVLTRDQYETLMTGPHRELFLGKNPDGGLQCPCAVTNAGIGSNGDVYPCIGAPIKAGNLREQSFKEIWKTSAVFQEIRALTPEDFKDCVDCSARFFCQRSSGSAYLNTGDYTGKDPRTCEVSLLRRDILEGQR